MTATLLAIAIVAQAGLSRPWAFQSVPPAPGDPVATASSAPPALSSRVRAQVELDQQSVDEALAHPENLEALTAAITKAQSILAARRTSQGPAWWETIEAERQLEDVRQFSEMSSEVRAAFADVYRRRQMVAELGRGDQGRTAVDELRMIADFMRSSLGEGHRKLGDALSDLGLLYYFSGYYREAEPVLREALAIRERVPGLVDPRRAQGLNALGLLCVALGNFDQGEDYYKRSISAYGALGPDYVAAIPSVESNLAGLYVLAGRSGDAISLYTRALSRAPDSVETLLSLASAHVSEASYDKARTTVDQARTYVLAKPEGRGSLQYADALDVLASIERAKGLFADAEARYVEAIDIRRRALSESHPDFLVSLSKLASLHTLMGRYAEAAERYATVRKGLAAAVGRTHLSYAVALNEQALLFQQQKPPEYTLAAANYSEALDTLEKTVGEQHPAYVTALHNLASVHHAVGAAGFADAERRYLEVRRILDARPLERRSLYATLLDNIARLYSSMHRYDEAERLVNQALTMRREMFGVDHPAYATSLNTSATILAATGRQPEAVSLLLDSVRADWIHVTTNLPALGDEQKNQFLSQSEFSQGERLWSLVFRQQQSPEAGVQAALFRKHLLFEATRQESGAFRAAVSSAPAEWRDMLDERRRLVNESATLQSSGTASDRQIRDMRVRIDELETRLRRSNPAYALSARLQRVENDDVARALRPGEALVEFVRYRPFDFVTDAWGPERYGAFVVGPRPAASAAVDLLDAKNIDDSVLSFREAMRSWISEWKSPGERSAALVRRRERALAQLAADVATLVWEPLTARLSGVRRVYVAPDGQLGLMPFEALARADAAGELKYLGEQLEFVYVPTGRDLGRLALTASDARPAGTAVLVGNPDFGPPQADTAAASPCDPMPVWAQKEQLTAMTEVARSRLVELGWKVTTLLGAEATEAAVFGAAAPQILQFGTHGYFRHCSGADANRISPLSQSLLMLAGANLHGRSVPGAEDGVLSALEVTGMNLQGTELVNLTACETGVGTVTSDGVAGLRQAFLWAGARALTMSMWEVPVDETTTQLGDFYAAWLGTSGQSAGSARYPAFRKSQLAALERARENWSGNPLFWASTVFVGDPGDLPPPAVESPTVPQ